MANYEKAYAWQTPEAGMSHMFHSCAHDGTAMLVRFHENPKTGQMPVYRYPNATPQHMADILSAKHPARAFNEFKKTPEHAGNVRLPPEPEAEN